MNDSLPDKRVENDSQSAPETTPPAAPDSQPNTSVNRNQQRKEARRWWIKLFVQPALLLGCGALLIMGLGVAQRFGFISSGGGGGRHSHVADGDSNTRYICPMMCTPPQTEPGRCPVCAMELVPLTSGGVSTDTRSIHIDPATRRVANIHTVAVTSMPMTRTIRAIGELSYDEGTLKTISAYVDGRLDRLYADYTGVVVKKGDHLALVYSPRLYSGQVELLLAKKSRQEGRSSTLTRVVQSNDDLYDSAKERLILLGMTEMQLEHLEEAGEANSQVPLCAPISGTVIEKMAVEGQYVKEGDAIYQLADLSTVWLMLKLFPEDAVTIRYGQKVNAEVQSLPGRKFTGRVAFIDPNVDPKTRTVGVRVVIPNDDGLLRVGDYAKATIDVPLSDAQQTLVYDPELANKWISPRHPQIVAASAGDCPICGVDLVPASQFGFTDQPSVSEKTLAVPRDAVLMAGNNSVVYVETAPGRFEIRRVVLGPRVGDQIVLRSGVEHGERVATRGNFLIDSQMQLAGNPSLIDPSRLEPSLDGAMSEEMIAALSTLSPEDRLLVAKQKICPVAEYQLGLMGTPQKVDVNGTPVFICCERCRVSLLSEPDKYLAKLAATPHEDTQHDKAPATHSQMDLPPIGIPQIMEPKNTEPATIEELNQETTAAGPTAKRITEFQMEVIR
ncbi:MAG: efflux RND transporter periplasmic adaptor subunit [Planctomycetota bacterium]|nr:efflux RND transporter periplasmic adaptor subunit [Planctomycetota bacterium]